MKTGQNKLIFVTGASGYVGGRLIPRLLQAGYRVRILARNPVRLKGIPWLEDVEVVQGDALQPQTLSPALVGVQAAYYLIHSMMAGADFHQRDLQAAEHFSQAAQAAGVQKIVYLGGLGDPQTDLSQHLRSRQDTGAALRAGSTPVLEFRAGVIVGSGSISFEMIRYLTERVPVMICPRWVFVNTQPISIGNVLDYLVAALTLHLPEDAIVEIGGPEVLSYGDMLRGYAQARGLKRWILPVPVLTPRLSSHWVHFVTPIPSVIARPLIDGLRNESVAHGDRAAQLFPSIQPISYQAAVQLALEQLHFREYAGTGLKTESTTLPPFSTTSQEGMIIERYRHRIHAGPADAFQTFSGLGGERGWLYADWAWKLRGVIDRLIGGVGFRRGRRHPNHVQAGDSLDFWHVESIEPERMMRLRAEMKLPGQAWLQFDVLPLSDTESLLIQTIMFAPKGLSGLLYWYVNLPIHRLISKGMARAIADQSQTTHRTSQVEEPQ